MATRTIRGTTAMVLALVSLAGTASNRHAWQPFGIAAAAQSPGQPGPAPADSALAIIRGRVVRQGDGAPIAGARVTAQAMTAGNRASALTVTDGSFDMSVTPGTYRLVATSAGFVPLHYGERLPGLTSRSISLERGQIVENVEIALPRGGVIGGRVVDARGEPAVNAVVQLLERQLTGGIRQGVSGRAIDRTDDRGEFRIHGILPGTYLLSAIISPADFPLFPIPSPGSLTTYYPGTLSYLEAEPVTVGPGDDLSGLVLPVPATRLATITGVVRTADGQPADRARLTMLMGPRLLNAWSSKGISIRSDGSFSVPDLAPGAYTLHAVHAELREDRRQIAIANVILDGSDVTVPLVLREGDAARGRIVFERRWKTNPPIPSSIHLSFEAADRSQVLPPSSTSPMGPDWIFVAEGLIGPRVMRVDVPEGWAVKAVRQGDADITDARLEFNGRDIEGIEVVLTDQISDISGTAVDARGNRVPDATVVVFPEDPRLWTPESRFVATVRADQSGRFSHRGLPPEQYLAVAVRGFAPTTETSGQVLQRLQSEAAARFNLQEGEALTLTLQLADWP